MFGGYEDKPREACGVAGVVLTNPNATNAAFIVERGTFALQHRGEEAAGICATDGLNLTIRKDVGLVKDVFPDDIAIHGLGDARIAMGHTRWGTVTSSNGFAAAQPHFFSGENNLMLATAHNGEYTNVHALANKFGWNAEEYATDSVFGNKLIGYHYEKDPDLTRSVIASAQLLEGSFSLLVMNNDELVACRDEHGFRPLVIGVLADGAGYAVASETPALEAMGATFLRDVEPGEVVTITADGELRSAQYAEPNPKHCVLEYSYFARSDGYLNGVEVGMGRRRHGALMAEKYPVDVDVIMGVPDSGVDAAFGYARVAGASKLSHGLKRNRYSTRTYIQPTQQEQELAAKLKYQLEGEEVFGKRVLLVDDTVVNATTIRHLAKLFEEAGAAEVHFMITTPPIKWPCYYGFENKDIRRLIAANTEGNKVELERRIAAELNIDSLTYSTIEDVAQSITLPLGQLCTACFTGDYPTPVHFVDKY